MINRPTIDRSRRQESVNENRALLTVPITHILLESQAGKSTEKTHTDDISPSTADRDFQRRREFPKNRDYRRFIHAHLGFQSESIRHSRDAPDNRFEFCDAT